MSVVVTPTAPPLKKRKITGGRSRVKGHSTSPYRKTPSLYEYIRCTEVGKFSKVLSPNAGTQTFGFAITLQDLPNYAEFTALYDQYQISFVKWHFICSSSDASTTINDAASSTQFPVNGYIHTAVDKTDVTPSGVDELRQYQSYASHRLTDLNGKKGCVSYQPRVNINIAAEAGTYLAQTHSKMWLDTASSSVVNHMGLKWAVSYPSGIINTQVDLQIYAQVWLKFRNVK